MIVIGGMRLREIDEIQTITSVFNPINLFSI